MSFISCQPLFSFFSSSPLIYSVTLAAWLIVTMGCNQPPSLRVYCAASFRPIMQRLAEQFEAETGVQVQLQLGGSNMLLSQIELAQTGDAFLPAENWYLEQARQKGLAKASQVLGSMHAVLISQQAVEHHKSNLVDWLQKEPRISFALPEVSAIGRVTKQALIAVGQWEVFHELVITHGVYKTTVTEVANDVAIGTADVGIVWNLVANCYDDLPSYELPELAGTIATVAIAPLTTSKQPELADAFVTFVVHSDFAMNEWKLAGLDRLQLAETSSETGD